MGNERSERIWVATQLARAFTSMFCIKKQFEHLSLVIGREIVFNSFLSLSSRHVSCFVFSDLDQPHTDALFTTELAADYASAQPKHRQDSRRRAHWTKNSRRELKWNCFTRTGTQDDWNLSVKFLFCVFSRIAAIFDWWIRTREKEQKRFPPLARHRRMELRRKTNFFLSLGEKNSPSLFRLESSHDRPELLLATPSLHRQITGLTQLRENSTKKRHQKHKKFSVSR